MEKVIRNFSVLVLTGVLLYLTYLVTIETGFRLPEFADKLIPPPPPPKIEYRVSEPQERSGFFGDFFSGCSFWGEKGDVVRACNYKNTVVRNSALKVVKKSKGELNLGQVCDLFDEFYNNWSYVNDPATSEYIAKASETFSNGYVGDCDDFAILMCSSILSIGGEARITYAYNDKGGHAFTEVNIGKTLIGKVEKYIQWRYGNGKEIHGQYDGEGNVWLNLDWWADYPAGEYFKADKGKVFYPLQDYCESI